MRILLPTHAFTDSPASGLHTVVWNTARELARRGHEVHVIATYVSLRHETKETLRAKGIALHAIAHFNMHNLSKPLALRCFLTALRLRMAMRFDWIYLLDSARTPFHRFKLGARLAVRVLSPDTPDVLKLLTSGDWAYDRERKDEEEGWEDRGKPLWYRIFSLLADLWFILFPLKHHTDRADLVFCQGKDTFDCWSRKLSAKTAELFNGVEEELFKVAQPPPRSTRRFVFLFIGRIARRKGLFHLLTAFGELRKSREDIELWIVGRGSKRLTEELEKNVARDREHIFSFGEIPHERIAGFMEHCCAFVDPMIYQGFSTSVIEAMYCAKPVIASCFGGTKDAVTDGEEGFLVDPRDEGALKERMERLCSDPGGAEAMGRAGASRVRAHFLWRHVGDILESSFRLSR